MQWKSVGTGLIKEQLIDSPHNVNGRVEFLEKCHEINHGNGNYVYRSWDFAGYLYCLDDNMTWFTSSTAEKSLEHIPVGTYYLPGGFIPAYAGHNFIRTSGSLKKFEMDLESIMNAGHPAGKIDGLFRAKRMKFEI